MTTTASAKRISVGELGDLCRKGKAANLIDVRTAPEYSLAHAEGARYFPLTELDAKKTAAGLQAGEAIYVLCKSGGRARMAQGKFAEAGVECVVVEGGTDAWIAAGLPTVRGQAKVWTLQRQAMFGAGVVNLIGVVLALMVHPYFIGINAFAACGLMLAGAFDFCMLGIVLSYMPWNRGNVGAGCAMK